MPLSDVQSLSAKVTITVVTEPKDLTSLMSKPAIQHNPEPVTFPPIFTPKLEGCPYCKTLVRYKGNLHWLLQQNLN
jgi:uncharacterized Zn-finger protein